MTVRCCAALALMLFACGTSGQASSDGAITTGGPGDGGRGDGSPGDGAVDRDGCAPKCGNNECGDDGCGGSCGSCATGRMCGSGVCVATGAIRCPASDCGADGMGSDCGECSTAATCDPSIGLCVPNGGDQAVSVTWGGACWWVCPQNPNPELGCTAGQRFQAMQMQVSDSFPVESTLYYTVDCDPSQGTDNLNDTGAPTPPAIGLEWFIHHPDEVNTSAVWWDGHHSSGCVSYRNAPDC